jgi:small subunit ribosomal protein S1
VIVDIGYKSEGIIPLSEFTDFSARSRSTGRSGGRPPRADRRPERLCRSVQGQSREDEGLGRVEKSYRSGSTVRGRVIDRSREASPSTSASRRSCPARSWTSSRSRNLESLRGKDLDFKVISVDKKRGNIVLSRKAVVEVEQEARKKETLQLLEEGRVLRGTVKNLTDYGAFVDLGGLDGSCT